MESGQAIRKAARKITRAVTNASMHALQKELAALTSHDHAPCVYCDPLRSENARLRLELEEARKG